MLIHVPTGLYIFLSPHLFHSRQQTKLESQPRRPNGVLSATKRRYPGSDIQTTRLHCPAGSHPFHSAPTSPSFKPLSPDVHINAFWIMALLFSLFATLLATLRLAMGLRLYEQLPKVWQIPLEEQATSTTLA